MLVLRPRNTRSPTLNSAAKESAVPKMAYLRAKSLGRPYRTAHVYFDFENALVLIVARALPVDDVAQSGGCAGA